MPKKKVIIASEEVGEFFDYLNELKETGWRKRSEFIEYLSDKFPLTQDSAERIVDLWRVASNMRPWRGKNIKT
jgi:hypothetical protein